MNAQVKYIYQVLLLALVPFALIINANNPPIALGNPEAQITTTRPSIRNRTPTPTPTPTATPELFNPKTINYSLASPLLKPPFCDSIDLPVDISSAAQQGVPQVFITDPGGLNHLTKTVTACVYGFPTDEGVIVEFYTPDNRKAFEETLSPEVKPWKESSIFTRRELIFPLLLSLPNGEWRVIARSPSAHAEGRFTLGGPGLVQLTVSRDLSTSTMYPRDPRWKSPYIPGDTMLIKGANFSPGSSLPVGIYQDETGGRGSKSMQPVIGVIVRTDQNGAFTLTLPIDSRYKPGFYWVIPLVDPNRDTYGNSDTTASFRVVIPQQYCPRIVPSRLKIGDSAIVVPGPPNNVREKAGLSFKKIGQIQPYQRVMITKGPKCSDGMTWWKIETMDHRMRGWTAEGDAKNYWLLP